MESIASSSETMVLPTNSTTLDDTAGNNTTTAPISEQNATNEVNPTILEQPDTQSWENTTNRKTQEIEESKNKLTRSSSLQNFLTENATQLIQCPNPGCDFFFEWVGTPGEYKQIFRDDDEDPSQEAILHYQRCRFRCRNCSEEFCTECKKIPYHEGYTCSEYKLNCSVVHCRFCDKLLRSKDPKEIERQLALLPKQASVIVDNCCDSCKFKNDVIHTGVAGSCLHQKYCTSFHLGSCPPCLHPDCVAEGGVTLEDDCHICGIDRLKNSPIVKLKCGHVFHYDCVISRLQNRWNEPEISFAFANCPICKQGISAFFKNWDDAQIIEEIKVLKQHLKLQIITQIKQENITTFKYSPDHPSFVDEALRLFNFYECFKCKSTYYGGARECGRAVNIKKEELLCNGCKNHCEIHGVDQMLYKCRFCCRFASYFCFGHTHFCDTCHSKAWVLLQGPNHEYLKAQMIQCPGESSCPLKVSHPPNGEEYAIGCAICMNIQDQQVIKVQTEIHPPVSSVVAKPESKSNNNLNESNRPAAPIVQQPPANLKDKSRRKNKKKSKKK